MTDQEKFQQIEAKLTAHRALLAALIAALPDEMRNAILNVQSVAEEGSAAAQAVNSEAADIQDLARVMAGLST